MKKYAVGVDLGGTSVKMGLFDVNGTVLDKWEIPTDKSDKGKNILPDIAKSIIDKLYEKNIQGDDVEGVGIGIPGAINAEGKLVGKAANIGWVDLDVSGVLSELVGLPVKAGNDANVAAYGEMWQGGGKGYKDLCMVTLGTGVGGGIICDGKLIAGAVGAGGEIGHIHVADDEPDECGCGLHGCLEQYTSATGVVRIAKRRLAKDNAPSSLRELKNVTAKDVFDAVKAGDKVAVEIGKQFGEVLGKGLAVVSVVANPEIFVIGGGVSKAGQIIIDLIKDSFVNGTIGPCKNTKFALATLGNDAGIIGAAGLLLNKQ